MRKRSRLRDVLEYAAAAAAVTSLEWTPLPVAGRLARLYAGLLDRCLPRLRRTALRNMELALPELPEQERRRIADGVFRSIARLLVAFARFPRLNRGNISEWIRYEGLEHFEQARERGRGILFATAHLGNWELSAYAHALLAEPMHVVVRPLDNRLLDRLVERRRSLSGNRMIEKRDFARSILKALAANEAVGILADQNTSPEQGVFVKFFGIPACSNSSLARLAAHTGATVIPGFALWEEAEQRYVLRFYPPVAIEGDPVADTQRIQRAIEDVVRQYPDQWLWIHKRWKTRPPGEPPLY
ncbi:MAG: lysophospholipid acyltransferase family protein [Bryobacteraceae bacterium]|nr:lysophospholipid acyltransferase family protein [Bryobacteraceae bacterium]